jgi:nucleotide-binding universal stress UspA family protein
MLAGLGVSATAVSATGDAAEEILAYAAGNSCDLIAMSTRGPSALRRGQMGSVTDAVMRASTVPVLAVGPKSVQGKDLDGAIRQVAVPLDGSELAEAVLPYVEALALKCGMRVVLVRAYQISVTFMGDMPDAYVGLEGVEDDMRSEATRYLNEVAERLKSKGIEVTIPILNGHPSQVLGEFAEEQANSMIAMCSHGRSGFSRWVLGSVAESTVRASGDPVLIIPQR